jgi:DNA ligase-associated metallophosphoesterase
MTGLSRSLAVAGEAPRFRRDAAGALWVEVAGATCVLRASGALWLPAERMLVAGDLHLEKGSSYAARGQLLPPYDTRETLARLEAEIAALAPRTLVLLGDSFHDARACERLAPDDRARVARLAWGRTLVWVVGNHDVEALHGLAGDRAEEARAGALVLRHEPTGGFGEVAGHLHPCAKVAGRGGAIRRRAYLTDGARLILPAFGAYTGGLNVLDVAFAGLMATGAIPCALGRGRVHPIAREALRGD